MTRRILLIIFIVISVLTVFTECKTAKTAGSMKTGKFIYVGQCKGTVVERTENYQIEYDTVTDYKIEFKIEWLSESQYNMIFIGGTKGCLLPGDTIKVTIDSYTKRGYKYIADGGHCGGIMTGEFIKIE